MLKRIHPHRCQPMKSENRQWAWNKYVSPSVISQSKNVTEPHHGTMSQRSTYWCSIWKLRCPVNQSLNQLGDTLHVEIVCDVTQSFSWSRAISIGIWFICVTNTNQKLSNILQQAMIYINSLGPSDAIWWQKTGSTLAQVMACCLTAPSHYLNQCLLLISKV